MKDIYKQYLKLNRNIFIAFAVDFVVSAMVAQMLIEQEHYLNTTITLLADHGTFLSILGFLLYLDNRNKYRLNSGTNWPLLKKDLVKIIASLGIAEIIYTIVRWVFQYYFLTVDYEPYLASIIGQIIAVSIYMVIINFLVKITKWYKND
jgi:branched-subunit amino acid ABC-type transport system permease component